MFHQNFCQNQFRGNSFFGKTDKSSLLLTIFPLHYIFCVYFQLPLLLDPTKILFYLCVRVLDVDIYVRMYWSQNEKSETKTGEEENNGESLRGLEAIGEIKGRRKKRTRKKVNKLEMGKFYF